MSQELVGIRMNLKFNAKNFGDAIYQVILKYGYNIDEDDNENYDALERLQNFSENIVNDIKRHGKTN